MTFLEAAPLVIGIAILLALLLLAIRVSGLSNSARIEALERGQERTDRLLREELAAARQELSAEITASRELLRASLEQRMDRLSDVLSHGLEAIQTSNEAKLEQMRQTVDEKLQTTLNERLGESFKLVSDRLEMVYKELGEMQSLAAGVGDLKRVLTNVKTRGTWGEVQLGNLLEQMLAPDQFARNVATTGTSERVEFAVKLPGFDSSGSPVWLPIDAKFPIEDFHRLVDASEKGDAEAVDQATRQLDATIKSCARTLSEKYLSPPATTDFGILFLSTESLYAEAVRRPGLAESIQRDHRVLLTGPSTLAALLNSLQMGFRTLAIQKRSGEVWEILGAVKTEFAKYAEVLSRIRTKLTEAANTIDSAEVRARAIQRKLRGVESSSDEPQALSAGGSE